MTLSLRTSMRRLVPFVALLLPSMVTAQTRTPDFTRPVWTSPVEFTALVSVRELGDGRLIAVEAADREIRLLSPRGVLVGVIGRQGGGPHEHGTPTWALPVPGDSTLVVDRDQERFLLIGPDAAPVGTIPWPTTAGGGLRGGKVDVDGEGRVYFEADGLPRPGRTTTELLRWDRRTGRIDTLATLEAQGVMRMKVKVDGGEALMTRAQPLSEGDGWSVAPNGEVVVVHPRDYRVDRIGRDGRLRAGRPIPFTPVPVTAADRARHTEGVSPQIAAQFVFPANKPAVTLGSIRTSPANETWLARFSAPGASSVTWDRIGADGRLAGQVQLPRGRMLIGFGRTLTYLVRTDENDVQWLEAYR